MLYHLALACLFTHELDAVTHAEWRLLFVLRDLPDPSAEWSFVALHVPLFFAVLCLSHHSDPGISRWTRIAVSGFVVVHALLHALLSGRPEYGFEGWLSNALIFGAAAFAIAFLVRLRAVDAPQ